MPNYITFHDHVYVWLTSRIEWLFYIIYIQIQWIALSFNSILYINLIIFNELVHTKNKKNER